MGAVSVNRKQSDHRGGAPAWKNRVLSQRQHRALVEATRELIDEIFEDYANMYKGRDPGATIIVAECLPPHFRNRYTESFVKLFIVCVVAVSGRLSDWQDKEIAHSTGECLALYAIIEKAVAAMVLQDKESGKAIEEDPDLDFRGFEKVAFVDGGYTFLFDPSLDDMADDEAAGYLGIPVRLKDWFIPDYEEPAHPYLWRDDTEQEDLDIACKTAPLQPLPP
ncbi:MAG: hypothetical protein M0Z41_14270 [Peptococcaceae bacterium]|jgi:hypothetical protein|nr:hypothetical protein [Peptococcaceae bacterium]